MNPHSAGTAEGGTRRPLRPWTRLGAIATGAHVFYELAAGVGMPFTSRIGPIGSATLFGVSSGVVFRGAGQGPPSHDAAFSIANGIFLSAVIGHFASWPRTNVGGLPWLTECEGLTGRLIPPYNLILYISGLAAVGGLVENRKGGLWGAAVPLAFVPLLTFEAPREYARLRAQAQRRPRWWNRRLR
jgi:hypothetical protein